MSASHRDPEHVSTEDLVRLENDALDAEAASRAREHLEACGQCAAELALVRAYEDVPVGAPGERADELRESFQQRLDDHFARTTAGRSEASGRPNELPWVQSLTVPAPGTTTSRSRRRTWIVGGMLAASLALIVVSGNQILRQDDVGKLGTGFRALPDGAPLQVELQRTMDGWQISWSAPGDVEVIDVVVVGVDGTEILVREMDAGSNEARYLLAREEIPAAEREALLLVRVRGRNSVGKVITSPPRRLE